MTTTAGPLLEVIALDAADAVAAQSGGADRLELVSGMASGGLTPEQATVREVLGATDLPVRVMLRDTDGYAPADLDGLRRQAAALREAGATEFVLGFLTTAGSVDSAACQTLLAELDGCRWTFHRAVDNAADSVVAWAVAAGLGCDTVLSAGSARGVEHGMGTLEALAGRQRPDNVALLAGGGLKSEHVAPLRALGVQCFHVGSAVRPEGWSGAISPAAVRDWKALVA